MFPLLGLCVARRGEDLRAAAAVVLAISVKGVSVALPLHPLQALHSFGVLVLHPPSLLALLQSSVRGPCREGILRSRCTPLTLFCFYPLHPGPFYRLSAQLFTSTSSHLIRALTSTTFRRHSFSKLVLIFATSSKSV